MRPRKELEAFDLVTGWPARIFDGYVAAERAGYKRSGIDQCVKGKQLQHHGCGWRLADETSRLGEFVRVNCHIQPDAADSALVEYRELYLAYRKFLGLPAPQLKQSGDEGVVVAGYELSVKVKERLERRFGLAYVEGEPRSSIYGKQCTTREVIKGLVWAA